MRSVPVPSKSRSSDWLIPGSPPVNSFTRSIGAGRQNPGLARICPSLFLGADLGDQRGPVGVHRLPRCLADLFRRCFKKSMSGV